MKEETVKTRRESLLNRIRNSLTLGNGVKAMALGVLLGNTSCAQATSNSKDKNEDKKEIKKDSVANDSLDSKTYTKFSPVANVNETKLSSPWDIVADREVGEHKNPIGAISPNGLYYGYLQFSRFNAENTIHYALINGGAEAEFAKSFYKTQRPGFQKALNNLAKAYKEKGSAAFVLGSKERQQLKYFLRSDFKAYFSKMGLGENKELFKKMQIEYANNVYTDFISGNIESIRKELTKQGIEFLTVDPAIVGMWLEHMIARGNGTAIPKTLKTVKAKGGLKYLNSAKYVDYFRKYPGTTCDNPSFIKEHLGGEHSVKTMDDVAQMLHPGQVTDKNQWTNVAIKMRQKTSRSM